MKTDDFITALAADLPTRPTSIPRALALALMVSTPIACGLLIYVLKVRPDIASAAQSVRFLFKLAFTLSMAGAGAWLSTYRESVPTMNGLSGRGCNRIRKPYALRAAPDPFRCSRK